jgi:hypothetical protein
VYVVSFLAHLVPNVTVGKKVNQLNQMVKKRRRVMASFPIELGELPHSRVAKTRTTRYGFPVEEGILSGFLRCCRCRSAPRAGTSMEGQNHRGCASGLRRALSEHSPL